MDEECSLVNDVYLVGIVYELEEEQECLRVEREWHDGVVVETKEIE